MCFRVIFFFFKQKTAYEMQRGLVGSEMCIRDRVSTQSTWGLKDRRRVPFLIETRRWNYLPSMCQHRDNCSYREKCWNAHNEYENDFHPLVYKREMCQYWESKDPVCPKYGKFCPFAHSKEELRDIQNIIESLYECAYLERYPPIIIPTLGKFILDKEKNNTSSISKNCLNDGKNKSFNNLKKNNLPPKKAPNKPDEKVQIQEEKLNQANLLKNISILEISKKKIQKIVLIPVSYTHLRAHETSLHLVCRLLLEKKKNNTKTHQL
eukprot:TRINITY_DN22300_c0_g1_i1.p2 TRINITY_DN22300_c0_g1~~TRINITY_DN22300_c0_g1_i1.p2  ORF type:complete len:265 (+),score=66.42 TRINITY_DN22300_c0_g1_i1:47-841(+)